ncbi:MAG TPA: STAS domain-containing protein [Tepidisphaeraceae bacterium]|jgi:anti-anti-sigma factor|nr:STAS domain-containing protein [Tepidisphaeraceae bacterium]
MKLPTEVFGDVVVVHTPEELNDELKQSVEEFLTTLDRRKVIVDLNGTETIDSGGLEALLKVQDMLRATSGDLKISTNSKINRKILEVTRLDEQLEVFDSVIDAVKSFV